VRTLYPEGRAGSLIGRAPDGLSNRGKLRCCGDHRRRPYPTQQTGRRMELDWTVVVLMHLASFER
jgi:hypothetical protein